MDLPPSKKQFKGYPRGVVSLRLKTRRQPRSLPDLTNLSYPVPTHPLLHLHLHLQPLPSSSHAPPTDRYSQPLPLRPLHVIHHFSFLLCHLRQTPQKPQNHPNHPSPGQPNLPSTLMDPATQTTVVGPYPLAQGSTRWSAASTRWSAAQTSEIHPAAASSCFSLLLYIHSCD